jgi:tetratricopeptide (TPR) repeat protein
VRHAVPPLGVQVGGPQEKLMLLMKANPGEAKAYAEELLAKAIQQKSVYVLEWLNWALLEKKENKELIAVAVRAAEANVRIDDGKDAYSLVRLANSYRVSGDSAKAKEYARKALDASSRGSPDQQEIEREIRKLGLEK